MGEGSIVEVRISVAEKGRSLSMPAGRQGGAISDGKGAILGS